MTAILIIGITSMILLATTTVLVAVICRQAASDAFRALDRRDENSQRQISSLLDRLMAIKWEDVVAMRSVDEAEEGGFIPPGTETDDDGRQEVPKWAHMSQMRERLDLLPEEQALLSEDFPEEMGANR